MSQRWRPRGEPEFNSALVCSHLPPVSQFANVFSRENFLGCPNIGPVWPQRDLGAPPPVRSIPPPELPHPETLFFPNEGLPGPLGVGQRDREVPGAPVPALLPTVPSTARVSLWLAPTQCSDPQALSAGARAKVLPLGPAVGTAPGSGSSSSQRQAVN